MTKTILITGSTDGIGLETAKIFSEQGHTVLLHGRSETKLEQAKDTIENAHIQKSEVKTYCADLSDIAEVTKLADAIARDHKQLDCLINNAGVLKVPEPLTEDGLDVRFVVNTYAPYILTQRLFPLMKTSGRILNLSSAAQAPIDLRALSGHPIQMTDMGAYAQSKLAITMWSQYMAQNIAKELGQKGPVVLAVNPGSLLASKMVKDGFGVQGNDLRIGADILVQLALEPEYQHGSGQYFDNDKGHFAEPHSDALDPQKVDAVMRAMKETIQENWPTA